jgi:hypothetical protein
VHGAPCFWDLPIRPLIAEPEEVSVSVPEPVLARVPEPGRALVPARVPERELVPARALVLAPALASGPWPAPRSRQASEVHRPLCRT